MNETEMSETLLELRVWLTTDGRTYTMALNPGATTNVASAELIGQLAAAWVASCVSSSENTMSADELADLIGRAVHERAAAYWPYHMETSVPLDPVSGRTL